MATYQITIPDNWVSYLTKNIGDLATIKAFIVSAVKQEIVNKEISALTATLTAEKEAELQTAINNLLTNLR